MWMTISTGLRRSSRPLSRSGWKIILPNRSRKKAESMKAKEGVIDFLNQVLRSELTAVHQYLLHAALCKHWGYERLHEHFSGLAEEEVGHSSGLIDHILYLQGSPDVEHLDAVTQR